jgi:HPr kinase/phosphorylase
MTLNSQSESHHGVLMNLSGYGVFITGKPGIGKSSLALELLHHNYQLIADDVVGFELGIHANVIGRCPDLLAGLLHSRELGLISVPDLFGIDAWATHFQLDYVIHLRKNSLSSSSIMPEPAFYTVCGKQFSELSLDINNPASLHHRITTWLTKQSTNIATETDFCIRQQNQMALQ